MASTPLQEPLTPVRSREVAQQPPPSPGEEDDSYLVDMILSDEEGVGDEDDDVSLSDADDPDEVEAIRQLQEAVRLKRDEGGLGNDDEESDIDDDLPRISPFSPTSPSSRKLHARHGSDSNLTPKRGVMRYFRPWGSARGDSSDLPRRAYSDNDIGGSSTSDDWSDYEEETDDWDPTPQTIDWDMPVIPTSFLSRTQQPSIPSSIDRAHAEEWVIEHGILLQAALQLLAERDQVGVEGSTDSTDNIWKKGPLKKLGRGTWKVKYVELRRGNLCYYEDSGEGRKTIHLRRTNTVVRESVKGPGFGFEILVQGAPPRFWSAGSEEERSAWLRAIDAAIIGGEEPRRDLDLTPYLETLERFETLRERLGEVDLVESYTKEISLLFEEESSIQLPLQWLQDRALNVSDSMDSSVIRKQSQAPHRHLRTGIRDFWQKLSRIGFAINDAVIPEGSPLAPERTMGAMTRCILEYDHAYRGGLHDDDKDPQSCISEFQAISYARDILMAIEKSQSRNDLGLAVEFLLMNEALVEVSQYPDEEPVHLEVSFAGDDSMFEDSEQLPHQGSEHVGWLKTKRKQFATLKWRRRYAVLSGTILSYYQASSPHPRGLRGQLLLKGASIVEEESEGDEMFVFSVVTSDERRLFSFESQLDYVEWKDAIQDAIDSFEPVDVFESKPPGNKSILKSISAAIPDGSLGIRAIRGATGGGMKVIRSAKDGGLKVIKGAVGRLRQARSGESSSPRGLSLRRRPSLQVLMSNTAIEGKRGPSVQCIFERSKGFTVREKNGAMIATVRAKLFQAFLLSGGPSGRLMRGDAIVELDFLGNAQAEYLASGSDEESLDDEGPLF